MIKMQNSSKQFMCRAELRLLFSITVVALIALQPIRAQVPSGAISGNVTDSSGAVLAAATVTATNRETSATRTVQTGSDGHYQFNGLRVGVYDVKSEAPGFQSEVKQSLN